MCVQTPTTIHNIFLTHLEKLKYMWTNHLIPTDHIECPHGHSTCKTRTSGLPVYTETEQLVTILLDNTDIFFGSVMPPVFPDELEEGVSEVLARLLRLLPP